MDVVNLMEIIFGEIKMNNSHDKSLIGLQPNATSPPCESQGIVTLDSLFHGSRKVIE